MTQPLLSFHVPRHLRCISSWVRRGGGLAKEPDLLTADLLPNFKDVAPSFTSVSPTYTFFLVTLFQPLAPSQPSSLPRDHHDLSPSGSLHFKKKTWPSSLPCSCLLQTSCPRSLRTLSIEAASIVATSSALALPEILLLWDKTHRLLLLRRTCCRFIGVDSDRAALRPVISSQSISEGLRHMPCPSHVIIPSTSFSFARTDWVGTTANSATAFNTKIASFLSFQPLRNLLILRAADQAAFDSQSSPVSFSKQKKKTA